MEGKPSRSGTRPAVCKKGQEEVQKDLLVGQAVFQKLRRKVNKEDLLKTLSYNFPEDFKSKKRFSNIHKRSPFRYLDPRTETEGFGGHCRGGSSGQWHARDVLPLRISHRDIFLQYITVLFTDGRYLGITYGPCIGHCSSEALGGGGIGAVKTSDWIYLNFDRGEINLLDQERLLKKNEIRYPFFVMRGKEILSRPWIGRRIKKMEARRRDLTPWARGFLDSLLSTEFGVRPKVTG
jgi:hypothetical protein